MKPDNLSIKLPVVPASRLAINTEQIKLVGI